MSTTTVTVLPPKKTTEGKPAHWKNNIPSKFVNPWPSYRIYPSMFRIAPYMAFTLLNWSYPKKSPDALVPVIMPNWEVGRGINHKIKATWLGHACFLVELPAKPSDPRGIRILYDPVFSMRCSSSQTLGPKRYTPAPCNIEEVPDIDVIIISHDHYDHMDFDTLQAIFQRPRKPLIFAPLGNRDFLTSTGADPNDIHIMDWWQSKRVEIQIPINTPSETTSGEPSKETPTSTLTFDITCTPSQHFTGRIIVDDYHTLWCSWVVEAPSTTADPSLAPAPVPNAGNDATANNGDGAGTTQPNENGTSAIEPEEDIPRGETVKVYFAGDTGYRAVKGGEDEDKFPHCPAFKEIGDVFGGFDFAMIPIGAYRPRQVMSPIHCAPQDSVRLFKDIRARKALGMHWGTWILTTEPVDEPPKLLRSECTKLGISHRDFDICDIGETRFF
ncbi:N-acyl-phosphatidylethanolamine-hydrolyzing phospholipase D [Amanita rubescens]|nr:N-acyl-phosphatidylethanolamine-hydrolyzing phospholipase D [Amanita rubescens]